jgi:dihydrofolate synthase/folylpolyglutamate synthase
VARRDFDWTPAGARWSWHGTHIALEDLPRPALAGNIQFANAAVALAALEALAGRRPGEPFDRALAQDNVATALESVKLPGRFQIVPGEVEWILDVAHNEPAALVLAAHLAAHRPRARTIAVAGFLADKDVPAIARALQGAFASWVLCSLPGPRGLEAGATAARLGLNASVPVHLASSVPAGLNLARSLARAGDRIVVFGSFLTVGPALEWLGSVPETPEL